MEIKKFNSKYMESFVVLIDKCFNIKNPDKIWLVRWKFLSNINAIENKIICIYDNDKIVAQYSNIALQILFKNRLFNSYLCQDMCVLEWYRWKWLISKMSKKLYPTITSKTFTIWFSNKNWVKVDKNSKWYWYNIINNLVSYQFPILFKQKNTYEFEKYNEDKIDKIDFSRFNLFNNYLKIGLDKKYIIWRYFDKPNMDYEFYVIKINEEIKWYVVFKINKWICTIFDFNSNISLQKNILINTFKNISLKNKCNILKIQLLENDFWDNFFWKNIKIKKKENIYFTLKNHNEFDEVDNLNKNNWIIITWWVL